MSQETPALGPRPFVFVLMPFNEDFGDIYSLGIKAAAEEAGAYAERVDEQMYPERSIVERIINQISKADVVVADMTGRNPNVFYEVGYAHALNKTVILLAQTADLPFDLNQRPHIIYDGKIVKLKEALIPKIRWAISELGKSGRSKTPSPFGLQFGATEIPEGPVTGDLPTMDLEFGSTAETLVIYVRNASQDYTPPITHLYWCTPKDAPVGLHDEIQVTEIPGMKMTSVPHTWPVPSPRDVNVDEINLHYRIDMMIGSLPVGAIEKVELPGCFIGLQPESECICKIRLLSGKLIHDFPFRLKVKGKPGKSARTRG